MKLPIPAAIDEGGYRERALERRDALVALAKPPGRMTLVERIAREAKRSLPPCFDLEDLIGEGEIALLRAATRYRPERGKWLTYARLVVHGAIIESVRRGNWREWTRPGLDATDIHAIASGACEPADAIDRRRAADRVRAAITWLPVAQQTVLEEFYSAWEPTLAEVAERLGCSEATVHTRRKKALAALRARLKTAA